MKRSEIEVRCFGEAMRCEMKREFDGNLEEDE